MSTHYFFFSSYMLLKKYHFYGIFLPLLFLSTACGGDEEQQAEGASQSQSQQGGATEALTEAPQIEENVAQKDTEKSVVTLVRTLTLERKPFRHEIQLRGKLQSDRDIIIGSRTSGRVENIKVQVGEYVKKGALLLQLDTELLERNLEELNNSLKLARAVYERQKNLWEQEVGSEIEYLEAENRFHGLEKRRKTVRAQINQAHVYAPFDATVEELFVKKGEMATPGTRLVHVLGISALYVYAEAADSYALRIKVGNAARIHILTTGKELKSKVSYVSRFLKEANRTFEIRVPVSLSTREVKPNQIALLFVEDYVNANAFSVPSRLIQQDQRGTYLYVAEQDAEGQKVATKKFVNVGHAYQGYTEVIADSLLGTQVLSQGATEVSDGSLITVVPDN